MTGIPLVPRGFTQPIYLEVCIPYGQPAGNYSGQLIVTASAGLASFTVPIALEVWDIDLPKLNDSAAFNTAFSFSEHLDRWYPPGTAGSTIWDDWLPFLAHHRVPGDAIYLGGPRPLAEYETLAASGAKWMNMADVSFRIPGGLDSHVPQSYTDSVIANLSPTMASMTELGLVEKMYVYGFDEMDAALNRSMRELYGGLKQHWPSLTTIATLNWDTMPADLPLDVWVNSSGLCTQSVNPAGSGPRLVLPSPSQTLPPHQVNSYSDYGESPSYLQPTAKEQTRQAWLASRPGRRWVENAAFACVTSRRYRCP